MPELARSWLLITVFLIPPGHCRRWRLLSIFFNPLWLIVCRAFFWLRTVGKWVIMIVVMPFKFASFLFGVIFRVNVSVWPEEPIDSEGSFDDDEWYSIFETLPFTSGDVGTHVQKMIEFVGAEGRANNDSATVEPVQLFMNETVSTEEDQATKAFKEEEDESSIRNGMPIDEQNFETINFSPDREASFKVDVSGLHGGLGVQDEREEVDGFYQEYRERMACFDRHNFERANELRAILTRILEDSSFPLKFASVISILAETSTGRTVHTRKIIKSIEAEFETFYVGQSCLCWDVLGYQYMKIQEMASYDPPIGLHYDKLADDFQYFRTLLVRFMEDERAGGERFWNYAQGRLASKNLLMVPSLAGSDHHKAEETRSGSIEPSKLLKIVDESIKTFHIFLTKDDKKRAQQHRKCLLWNVSQVEDANDIELLSVIQRTFQKKEASIMNLRTEKKSWLLKRKRSYKPDETDRVQYLFCLIDLELVSRVLNMSIVSTQQLHWCQDKLTNIRLEGGRLERGSSVHLFPSS